MPSNYEAITADNTRRRGEEFDDIGEFLAEQFYSDQTHFIYELLQNAQDALKRRSEEAEPNKSFPKRVSFSLYSERLELRHYGQPFTEEDVKGISDILRGTKALDKKQIGKFGIGFKSVYAFTETPTIHSGDEDFVIEHYIRPRSTSSIKLISGETLFIFPFNHRVKTSGQTYERIRNRLAALDLRTLLFLDEIDEIVWYLEETKAGAYIREKEQIEKDIWKVTLLGEEGKKTSEERWLIFQHPVNSSDTKVEIAFNLGLDEKTKLDFIKAVEQSSLYAYFATDRETRLRFLIQGQYRTTPSRDNVLVDDEFNKLLISETAKLLVRSLERLKSMGLLNAQTLETMPLKSEHFPQDSFFRPIYEEFQSAMMTSNFLPVINGKFTRANEAKLARGSELIELLPADSLKALFGFSKEYQWLSDDITRDKTPDLRGFLINTLNIEEIDPEKFSRQIMPKFLQSQTDEWLIKFYEFLDGQRALWRAKSSSEREGVLRSKPFIRTEDGKMIQPFDQAGNLLVFLPGSAETDFPIVKKSLLKNKSALKFLQNLGLGEPDLVDEVLKFVLPRYSKGMDIAEDVHLNDIKKIKNAFETATGSKKDRLLKQLRDTCFLRAYNPGNAKRVYKRPSDIYVDDDDLRCYFGGNPDVWFYDNIYIRFKELLEDLGVNRHIRMSHNGGKGKYKILENIYRWHIRGVNGFDPDWEVDGLSFAIQNPDFKRSKFIWENILRQNKHLIFGSIEKSPRQDFSSPDKECKTSKVGEIVIRGRWLPDHNGKFHFPAELSLDDLPDDFFRDEELAILLGMKEVTVKAFAVERGIDENDLNLALEWIRVDPVSFKRWASKMLEKPIEVTSSNSFDFVSTLQDTFEKPSEELPEEVVDSLTHIAVQDPERRRKKVQEDLIIAMLLELEKGQRFRQVPSIVWEKKDNRVRAFLFEEYHGRCQICDSTFNKRNGQPYFEGLYLVSRTNAQWVDRPGTVICLCPTCCAKFQHGEVMTEDVVSQITHCRLKKEGGSGHLGIIVGLCGEQVEIHFSERHMLDLQEMIKASEKKRTDNRASY